MTPRMKEALDAIRRLTVDGVSPTYRQLKEELGLTGLSAVHRVVHQLRREGLVHFDDGHARSLSVINAVPSTSQMLTWTDAEIERATKSLLKISAARAAAKGRAAA